jgi:hypothetical protein
MNDRGIGKFEVPVLSTEVDSSTKGENHEKIAQDNFGVRDRCVDFLNCASGDSARDTGRDRCNGAET